MHVEVLDTADASGHNLQLLSQLYRLRARVFAGRLDWDVSVENGEEKDDFDLLHPTYLAVVDRQRSVIGGVRLLPATGPTMLTHTFPFLLDSAGSLTQPSITVESSRFCVDTDATADVAGTGLKEATHSLFSAIIEWSIRNGFSTIATVTDVRFERILKRAGWPLHRLGAPQAIGNTMAVAGTLPADPFSFERVKPEEYRPLFPQLSAVA